MRLLPARFQRNVKVLLIGMTIISSLPFAAGLIFARFFFDDAIAVLIYTQSTTAFGAFVIQLGLRAGLRKEYVEGT